MNVVKPGRPEEGQAVAAEVEGEIRGLVRREVATYRRPAQPEPGSDALATQVNSLIQRVSITSVKEIDRLIAELQSVRDFLHNESQRVQREVAGYAHLSETALKSTRIIAESMGKWKSAPEPERSERA